MSNFKAGGLQPTKWNALG